MKKELMVLALAACCGCGTFETEEAGERYVDTYDLSSAVSGYGMKTRACRSTAGGPLTLQGKARDEKGKIIPNPDFPDMKGLTDHIHSFGFKAGLYSSPGPRTCGSCEGSYGHELQDAESWADWGFDYVKYDWCSYGKIFDERLQGRKPTEADWSRPYRDMNECLKKQKRDILFSFCQYGMAEVHKWARGAGANCWRSWGDLKDSWVWMQYAIESHIGGEYDKWCGTGCWADPDMMIVGQQYSFAA